MIDLEDDYYEYEENMLDIRNEDDNLDYYINNLPDSVIAEARVETYSFHSEITSLYESCVKTILHQGLHQSRRLLISCILYQLCIQSHFLFHWSSKARDFVVCCISVFFGVMAMSGIYSDILFLALSVVVVLLFVTFCLMQVSLRVHHQVLGKYTSFVTVFFIITTEVFLQDSESWNRMRGIMLLISMKVISYSFDAERSEADSLCVLEYFAYAFHPGTLVFGPWVSLDDYRDSIRYRIPFKITWVLSILKNFTFAITCLIISTCFASHLFIDPTNPYAPSLLPFIANNWMQAYSTAISFHFSHYYICYLSVVTNQLSGCGYNNRLTPSVTTKKFSGGKLASTRKYNWLDYKVTNPLSVEIPRSMSNVVVAWNIPTSWWLKNYVFKTFRHLGVFPAILSVYIASAMLHGISIYLSLVLCSLAIYTYVEEVLRAKIARKLGCSYIKARTNEPYNWKSVPIYAHVFNFLWILINIMHLSYLGSLFGNDANENGHYSFYHTFSKWFNLNFFSHFLVAFFYLISCFI